MTKGKTGVQEWAKHSFNFQKGCVNGCKYCYARRIMQRFEPDFDFEKPVLHLTKTAGNLLQKTVDGVIMFPTMHDISPLNKQYYKHYLYMLLNNNNNVLVVTKGNPEMFDVIDYIITNCPEKLYKLELRVTIGSMDNKRLKHFEPNAPKLENRLNILKYAYNKGIRTSISCEPMLDSSALALIYIAQRYSSEIWFGLANGFYEDGMPKITDKWVQILINTADRNYFIKLKDSLNGKRQRLVRQGREGGETDRLADGARRKARTRVHTYLIDV